MFRCRRQVAMLFSAVLIFYCSSVLDSHAAFILATTAGSAQTDERERGVELYKRGDLGGATKVLRQVVKQDKTDGIAWYYLGLALYGSNKNKDARKALEVAVTLRPNDSAAHAALAYTFLLTNKLGEADREARRAITLNEKSSAAYYVLSVISLRTGNFDGANNSASIALQIEPNMPMALLLKSQVLINMLSYASLRADKKPFPDAGLDNSDYLLLKEAAQYLEKYLQLKPDSAKAKEWREQLETLRFYANLAVDKSPNAESVVLKPTDVTTKARILSKPSPSYTGAARDAQVVGTVVLQMILGADGKVRHILVLQWLSNGLVDEAVKAARQIKFVPATKDGQPVSQYVRVEYNFSIY